MYFQNVFSTPDEELIMRGKRLAKDQYLQSLFPRETLRSSDKKKGETKYKKILRTREKSKQNKRRLPLDFYPGLETARSGSAHRYHFHW